jgi:hypothetical protein
MVLASKLASTICCKKREGLLGWAALPLLNLRKQGFIYGSMTTELVTLAESDRVGPVIAPIKGVAIWKLL